MTAPQQLLNPSQQYLLVFQPPIYLVSPWAEHALGRYGRRTAARHIELDQVKYLRFDGWRSISGQTAAFRRQDVLLDRVARQAGPTSQTACRATHQRLIVTVTSTRETSS